MVRIGSSCKKSSGRAGPAEHVVYSTARCFHTQLDLVSMLALASAVGRQALESMKSESPALSMQPELALSVPACMIRYTSL